MKKAAKIRNYENVNKCHFKGTGKYDIPIIHPEKYEPCRFIGFNCAASCKKERDRIGIHFYLDDYQFLRVWNMIDYYLPMLRTFKFVMAPDFSIYLDYPLALQIYNHYRKHWIGAYLQHNGIRVIPTISWSDKSSYDWCFDGEPAGSVVSVSAIGTQMNKRSKELFLEGYREMMTRLRPQAILFYGAVPEECEGNIIKIKSYQEKFMEEGCDGRERFLQRPRTDD